MAEEKTPGTEEQPQYLTKEEFGRTAAMIRGLKEENVSLKGMMEAVVEKGEDGTYRLKVAAAPVVKQDKGGEPEWKTEITALRGELAKRDKQLVEKDQAMQTASKRGAIVDALTQGNAVNPQRDAVHLFDQVRANSDGKYVSFTKDDAGNDVEVPLNQFVTSFLKVNPELVRAAGRPGSGTPASAGGKTGVITLDGMSTEDYAKNREAIRSGKMKLV